MKKLVRPAYPIEVSVLMLCAIFLYTWFCSHQIFDGRLQYAEHRKIAYVGMLLVGIAVVIATLVVWEELLFPVRIKHHEDTLKVRNHRRKLQIQVLLYLTIPMIFSVIYFTFKINLFHYLLWAAPCILIPIVVRLFSGIKNYNDYLMLSSSEIEYKNNEKEGKFPLAKVEYIRVIKDSHNTLSKLKLGVNNSEVTIDLDEMELDAFYGTIQEFVQRTYKNILKA